MNGYVAVGMTVARTDAVETEIQLMLEVDPALLVTEITLALV